MKAVTAEVKGWNIKGSCQEPQFGNHFAAETVLNILYGQGGNVTSLVSNIAWQISFYIYSFRTEFL